MKIGIIGYGNLGKGVESAVSKAEDMELTAVFTRRDASSFKTELNTPVYSVNEIPKFKDIIDVMILCGGSATDLPEQTPEYASMFNCVDSFDTHAKIPQHLSAVNKSASAGGKVTVISVGWDPGLFSMQRALFESVLPEGECYTFWGKGVSQGHSDAIRRIDGVKNAKQYTVPVESAVERVRNGENPELSTREKHLRDCYVVLEENADPDYVENEIKTMPNYFADYDTTVTFIDEETFIREHSGIPHGGFVIRSGNTQNSKHVLEFSLKLESNPEFTASVLTAYARAAYKLNKEGASGAKTVFDIPISYLSPRNREEMIKELL